ncbi:MAG: metallophosphoesterase [Alphaproteobacteria bacterium]|nr:metallophosphoesterase [Alphaproteobacteria bacterium]
MPFFLAFSIVSVAVVAILTKTYVGYGNYSWWTKGGFFLFLLACVGAPFIAHIIKNNYFDTPMIHLIKVLYFFFGFVFFLFIITILRDFAWTFIDLIKKTPLEEIKNPPHINTINLLTMLVTLLVSVYGVYEANKLPRILTYNIESPKIKESTKVVMLSDLHIDVDVSAKRIADYVEQVNKLNPDVVVLAGDVVDNSYNALKLQMEELKKLSPKKGVYVALGNHEFYSGHFDWVMNFGYMKFNVVGNYGEKIGNTGLFVGGIPDINSAHQGKMKIIPEGALYGATKDDYVVILSHTPKVAKGFTKDNVDMILSGHTHGGQVYPFHYFVKQANEGRLAGFYDVDGIKMYISRGTRYWGPPMRIGAPSEITVFNFEPKRKTDE